MRTPIQSKPDADLDSRLAERLKSLRMERGWSLHDVAERSGISRATLSRLENATVSATAAVLGKLCAVHGLTLSRLMYLVEQDFPPVLRRADQAVWEDRQTGFTRRSVSPPSEGLNGEALECRLEPGSRIAYEASPRPNLEHHLIMLDGRLRVSADGTEHALSEGDCLRYRLTGPSAFRTPYDTGARYLLFII